MYLIIIKLSVAGARAGAGAEIRICSSVELEPKLKEILSAPQHCFLVP
jgi:hypothetical protein